MQFAGLSASSVLVAVVAIRAVVDVATHALVIGIGLRFLMAVGALEHQVVARVRMAGRANAVGAPVIGREPGVIKGRAQPTGGGVTRGAGCGEAGGYVVRIVRGRVVSLMTGIAVCRQTGVVVVHVALCARHLEMEPGQREGCRVVIESRRNPCRGVMAHVALLRETGCHVVWTLGGLEILQVTGYAESAGQLVVIVDVALTALHGGVKASERPASAGVIKRSAQP